MYIKVNLIYDIKEKKNISEREIILSESLAINYFLNKRLNLYFFAFL